MKRLIVTTLIILATLNLLDMACTLFLVSHFGIFIEGNPAMRAMITVSPFLFVLFKVLISTVLYVLAIKRHYIRHWMIVFVIPLLVYAWIVGLGIKEIALTL